MIFAGNASLEEKLRILSDGAKYDVACTSSGVDRGGKPGEMGNTRASGLCHAFSGDGRCISLLKILFTNECIYNCRYCINRAANDIPRATFTPEEVCHLTMEFYRRNYIEGLFLSSGIVQSPDYTMEQICQVLHDLRLIHRFNGYIHCKAIPGASPELVEMAGWYADRMSVNLELPTTEGLRQLAPNKNRRNILTPMRQIQSGMEESCQVLGMKGGNKSAYWYTSRRMGRKPPGIGGQPGKDLHARSVEKKAGADRQERVVSGETCQNENRINDGSDREGSLAQGKMRDTVAAGNARNQGNTHEMIPGKTRALSWWRRQDITRGFVPAGQSTQMIIGATGETDFEIVSVSEALYRKFDLKRVFYSAFVNVNQDSSLPAVGGQPPLMREHRLYQADFLLRYYGFEAGELLSEKRPNFNVFLDPKCDWALGHIEQFPVEINTADYSTLLRVPGIGVKSAGRIVGARKTGTVDFHALKKMGVVLKRALYFITCNGRMMYDFLKVEEDFITRRMVGEEQAVRNHFEQQDIHYRQLSLFDTGYGNAYNAAIKSGGSGVLPASAGK